MTPRTKLRFKAHFQCIVCHSELYIETFVAVVKSQTGYLYECPKCKQGYTVTDKGAIPDIDRVQPRYIDANGNDFDIPPYNPEWTRQWEYGD